MVLQVSDKASNRREQIANFAELLRNAPARQKVFIAVYRAKKASKTVQEISDATGYDPKRVTEIAKPLARGENLFQQDRERVNGKTHTVYRKLDFVLSNRKKILRLAADKNKLDAYHTKSNPRVTGLTSQKITIRVPFRPKTTYIIIDDVQQFHKAKEFEQFLQNSLRNGCQRKKSKQVFHAY